VAEIAVHGFLDYDMTTKRLTAMQGGTEAVANRFPSGRWGTPNDTADLLLFYTALIENG